MPTDRMQFASSVSDHHDPVAATKAVVARVAEQLGDRPCHLAVFFVSMLYRATWDTVVRQIRQQLGHPVVIGCTAGGVLGVNQELEAIPAMSLAAAYLPRVTLHPFAISPQELEHEQDHGFWIEKIGIAPAQKPVGILLPEPFSCDVMALVETLGATYPAMPLIGGLASGAAQAGDNALFFNDQILTEGAIGVALTGDVTLQTIVAQGCRPIGRPYIVTKAEQNFVFELAGLSAVEALRQLYGTLSPKDQTLAQHALFLGIVTNEQQAEFRRGDFLIRNLIGIDPSSGAIAVGDRIRVGQTVQFQIRDADTSREDLQHLLSEHAQTFAQTPVAGALLFSCLGRGRDLYGESHYDIRTIQAAIGTCPIAGFFCNGEIGPVGGHNFIHGFTSSLGLFRPRADR